MSKVILNLSAYQVTAADMGCHLDPSNDHHAFQLGDHDLEATGKADRYP